MESFRPDDRLNRLDSLKNKFKIVFTLWIYNLWDQFTNESIDMFSKRLSLRMCIWFIELCVAFRLQLCGCVLSLSRLHCWFVYAWQVDNRACKVSRGGQRTEQGRQLEKKNKWEEMEKLWKFCPPPTRLSSNAGARPSATPCPMNWATQEKAWTAAARGR